MTLHTDAMTFVARQGDIEEYVIRQNGLRVLIAEDHTVPVAHVMMTYHVGSRNEAVGHTGATHMLEHLLFKGTRKFNKANGKEIWHILESRGARLNATTWFDRTNYYALVPNHLLKVALAYEADRCRNAIFTENDRAVEMTIVRNEFERGESDPFQITEKHLYAAAFMAHPYHHPTIGWRSDIENMPLAELRKFYNTFYWPNNATLTVMGDFDKQALFESIVKYFAKIPRSKHEIPHMYTSEPPQEGVRRITVEKAGETRLIGVAHKTPSGKHEDTYALQVLSALLCGGRTGRFIKNFVNKGKASEAVVWHFPLIDEALFITFLVLAPKTSFEEAEEAIVAECEKIAQHLDTQEVERHKTQIIADAEFSRDGPFGVAMALNEFISLGDWKLYPHYIENIRKVSARDVMRVAGEYCTEKRRTVAVYRPNRKIKHDALKNEHASPLS